MTLNDDTEITHSEMKIDGTVKVYIETPNDTGGFHHATCWLPEYKWQDIKGYSNLEIAYFKNYIASVSHIIMELSRTGGFNALYEKASPDLESLKIIKLIIRNIRLVSLKPNCQRAFLYYTRHRCTSGRQTCGANQWSNL